MLMIILMIILYIYLMKNIKGVNLTTKNIREQTPYVVNQAVSPILVTISLLIKMKIYNNG